MLTQFFFVAELKGLNFKKTPKTPWENAQVLLENPKIASSDFKNSNYHVFVILSHQCPCCQKVISHILDLVKIFPKWNWHIIAVNSINDQNFYNLELLAQNAKISEWHQPFYNPLLALRDQSKIAFYLDIRNQWTKHYKIAKTPSALIYYQNTDHNDKKKKNYDILFQGGLTDRTQLSLVQTFYLKEALIKIQNGVKPSQTLYPSLGCSIPFFN
jgi:hypothetical protein